MLDNLGEGLQTKNHLLITSHAHCIVVRSEKLYYFQYYLACNGLLKTCSEPTTRTDGVCWMGTCTNTVLVIVCSFCSYLYITLEILHVVSLLTILSW